jgi:PII-like signaling protein
VLEGPAERLRIILGQADQHRRRPAFVEVIQRARSTGMAGATALSGVAGYGGSSRVHHRHTLRLSADTPVDIVIVDRAERIDQFAAGLDELIVGGLIGRQPVEVLRRRPSHARREASTGDRRQTKLDGREVHVRLEGPGKRLTVYCGEADRYHHHSLADAVVEMAREEGIAGATVLRGIEGFGASSHLHTSRILSMSDDLPVVIEMVDREDRIRAILPRLEHMMGDGLVTLEDLQVWLYRARPRARLDDEDDAPRH